MSDMLDLYTVLQVDSVFETYDQFFNLSPEVKAKYAKTKETLTNGWDSIEKERLILLLYYTRNTFC